MFMITETKLNPVLIVDDGDDFVLKIFVHSTFRSITDDYLNLMKFHLNSSDTIPLDCQCQWNELIRIPLTLENGQQNFFGQFSAGPLEYQ